MDSRLVVPTGEELHAVTGIDNQRVRDVLHEPPDAVGREDLERGDRLRPEDGNGAEVCVALEPDVLTVLLIFLRAWIAIMSMSAMPFEFLSASTYYFMKRTGSNACRPLVTIRVIHREKYLHQPSPAASKVCIFTNVSSGSSIP